MQKLVIFSGNLFFFYEILTFKTRKCCYFLCFTTFCSRYDFFVSALDKTVISGAAEAKIAHMYVIDSTFGALFWYWSCIMIQNQSSAGTAGQRTDDLSGLFSGPKVCLKASRPYSDKLFGLKYILSFLGAFWSIFSLFEVFFIFNFCYLVIIWSSRHSLHPDLSMTGTWWFFLNAKEMCPQLTVKEKYERSRNFFPTCRFTWNQFLYQQ